MKSRMQSFLKWMNGFQKKNGRIRLQLMLSFITLSILLLLVIGLFSYYSSSGAIRNKISRYSYQLSYRIAYEVREYQASDEDIMDRISFSDTVQTSLAGYGSMDDAARLQFNQNVKENLGNLIATKNGIAKFGYLYSSEFEQIKLDNNLSCFGDEDFKHFKAFADEGNGSVRWVLWKGTTGADYFLVACKEIKSLTAMKPMGYVFVATSEKGYSDIFRDMDLGQGTEILVLNDKGEIISSRDKKFEVGTVYKNKNLITKVNDVAKEKKNTFNISLEEGSFLAAFSPISQSSWYVVCTVPYQYLNSEANRTGGFILLLGIICLAAVIALSVLISGRISKPLRQIMAAMSRMKSGDLNAKVKIVRKDELGELASSFNEMTESIALLIARVDASTQKVAENALSVSAASQQNLLSSEQIAATVGEIAKGMENQAFQTTQSMDFMSALSTEINKVGDEMKRAAQNVSHAQKLSSEAQGIVDDLGQKVADTTQASKNIIQDINNLNEQMKEIRKITKLIIGISDQSRLLALNAAIEAARAGNAGKGFAVVADEVGMLANQIKQATGTIEAIIRNAQEKTEDSVLEANHTEMIVRQQVEAVRDTGNAFKAIFAAMEGISSQIGSLEETVQVMVKAKGEVQKNIEDISAISEETAAAVEEISASTEEQLSTTTELADTAKDLNGMVEELNDSISKFQTKK